MIMASQPGIQQPACLGFDLRTRHILAFHAPYISTMGHLPCPECLQGSDAPGENKENELHTGHKCHESGCPQA
ncbi:hypothetical protein EK904_002835 [Melospiza melodia maxima]|nr:hypothetical protein EK904_002835 [Melospiza melodia maxima]